MNSSENLKRIIKGNPKYSRVSGVKVFEGTDESCDGARFFTETPGRANLRKLSENETHQCAWEFPAYSEIVRSFLGDDLLRNKDARICDLGAGDGRFTLWLLDNFPGQVIAVEIVKEAVVSLAEKAAELGYQDRLIIVRGSFHDLPLTESSFDAAIAINSLYYLQERVDEAVRELSRLIKPNGIVLTTRHCFEAMLMRSLFFNGVGEFLNVVSTRTMVEGTELDAPRFPVGTKESEIELFQQHGFGFVKERGVPVFEQMISLLSKTSPETREQVDYSIHELTAAFEDLRKNCHWSKTFVMTWKKKEM